MPKPSESITLYGQEAEEFRRLRDDVVEDVVGWNPSNAKTVAFLMAHFDEKAFSSLFEDVETIEFADSQREPAGPSDSR